MTSVIADSSGLNVLAAAATLALLILPALALAAGLRFRGSIDLALLGTPLVLISMWSVIIEGLSVTAGISRTSLTWASIALGAVALSLWNPKAFMCKTRAHSRALGWAP